MIASIKPAGIVTVTTTDGEAFTLFADRGREADNLREQAEELRTRAASLLQRAAMFEDVADRLGGDYVVCPNCRTETHLSGLIGETTDDCPRCGKRAIF